MDAPRASATWINSGFYDWPSEVHDIFESILATLLTQVNDELVSYDISSLNLWAIASYAVSVKKICKDPLFTRVLNAQLAYLDIRKPDHVETGWVHLNNEFGHVRVFSKVCHLTQGDLKEKLQIIVIYLNVMNENELFSDNKHE